MRFSHSFLTSPTVSFLNQKRGPHSCVTEHSRRVPALEATAGAVNMRTGCSFHDGWILQMKRLLQRLQGLWRHLREHPTAIWLCRPSVGAARIDAPAIPVGLCLTAEQTDNQANHRRDTGQRFA